MALNKRRSRHRKLHQGDRSKLTPEIRRWIEDSSLRAADEHGDDGRDRVRQRKRSDLG